MSSRVASAWPALRYDRLLPLAQRGRRTARCYAAVIGTVEFLLDPVRRETASQRIARRLGIPARQARATFRASLISEAWEEAEVAFLMAHPEALARVFSASVGEPAHTGRTIYATLHLGAPILAYLYLAWRRELDVTIIGRTLGPENPLADAKRRHGHTRVAWVESLSQPFLTADSQSISRARDMLLANRSLFAAMDIPGDVVARAATVDVLGERFRFASGMVTLAHLAGASLQPLVAVSDLRGVSLHWGRRVEPAADESQALAAVFGELMAFVRRFPGEWWMWPYLVAADPERKPT